MSTGRANNLRALRRRASLTQEEVATLLGLSQDSVVSRHESGTRVPPIEKLVAYAKLYGVSIESLIPDICTAVESTLASNLTLLIDGLAGLPPTPRLARVKAALSARREELHLRHDPDTFN